MKYLLASVLFIAACQVSAQEPKLEIKTDFPGGSARVLAVDSTTRTVVIAPGGNADRGWVCWWYFQVQGLKPGEVLTVEVVGTGFAIPDQATFSLDRKDWKHTATGERKKGGIVFRQKIDGPEAWFAWGPPYLLSDARAALEKAAKRNSHARIFKLCKSKDGHSVPALKIEEPTETKEPRKVIWIHARQHAWESGSSWVCDGFLEWIVSDEPAAVALRQKAILIVVPIMDVDNVQVGNGGKNQKPHDHNRDWSDQPVHPEVQAAQAQILALKKKTGFDLFIDLHNPGPGDRKPFFFTPAKEVLSPKARGQLEDFLRAASKEIQGELRLEPTARSTGAGYDKNWEKISTNWISRNTSGLGVCLETAWNHPASTIANYRQVGQNLGRAIERYFRDEKK